MNLSEAKNLNYSKKQDKPFGIKDKLGYLFGDFGNDFMFIFANMYFMIFYTKVLGVSAAMVGTCFLVARCIDAFTDIAIGRIIDKSKPTKHGKFRSWIMRVAGPVALMNFLMYQHSLANASMTIKIGVMFATYILWGSIFYTAINIPYGSMSSVMTGDTKERASLSTWRTLGASFAGIIIGALTPQLIYSADAAGNQIIDPQRFTVVVGVFSIAAFICYMLCFILTTERIKPEIKENQQSLSLIDTFKSLTTNKAMISMVVVSIVLIFSTLMGQTVNTYLCIDYFNNVNALSTLSIISLPIYLVVGALAAKLADKFGKKEVSMIGLMIAGGIFLVAYFMHIKNAYTFIAIYAAATLGTCIFSMLSWAFITDIIDYNELKTGERNDATIYGVYSFTRKLGQAVAGAVTGYALTLIGYDSLAATQVESVKTGIYALSTLFPAACYILAGLLLMITYPLTKKVVQENVAKLRG
ncbi:MAG: glycoside-pentoside-hexuronide (GPH):cation symporter [Peptostreptococcaceae bacterium]|mgnify:CR=1 FL=1|nr:glycoside-pentoside-hexuronide (GPH):cation symporter [Peptostreptococcaceae bacterium]